MQYNTHCIFTFAFVRSVKRSSRLQEVILPKTVSIIPILLEYKPRITLAKMIVRDNRLYLFLYRIFQIILTKKPGIRQNRFLP